jgi:hypothetical protein
MSPMTLYAIVRTIRANLPDLTRLCYVRVQAGYSAFNVWLLSHSV